MTSNRSSTLRIAGLVLCAVSAVLPRLAAQDHQHYSRTELRKMMQQASTPEQLQRLATWFREEEATLRGKAEAENRDYERYKVQVQTKVPTRADNARSLRDRYSQKADHVAALAARCEIRLAQSDRVTGP